MWWQVERCLSCDLQSCIIIRKTTINIVYKTIRLFYYLPLNVHVFFFTLFVLTSKIWCYIYISMKFCKHSANNHFGFELNHFYTIIPLLSYSWNLKFIKIYVIFLNSFLLFCFCFCFFYLRQIFPFNLKSIPKNMSLGCHNKVAI